MFTTRHLHFSHTEVFRWLAIITLAALLLSLAARMASGGDAARPALEPGRLPAAVVQLARPMAVESSPAPAIRKFDAAQKLWEILTYQKDGNFEQAVEEWSSAPLSCEAEVWRHVSLAQAQLGLRDLAAAQDSLDTALALDHDNAVAHYFRGLLRLEQAATARDWNDAIGPVRFQLVSTRPFEPSLTRSMYRLAARMELELAIDAAARVDFDQPLCSPTWPTSSALGPTVRDLLIALHAEDFEGKAHHVLSYLLMEDGTAHEAEQHLDQAAALGQCIVFGYQDLGALYQRQYEHLDAVRAYAKALSHGSSLAQPTARMLQNLRLALVQEF